MVATISQKSRTTDLSVVMENIINSYAKSKISDDASLQKILDQLKVLSTGIAEAIVRSKAESELLEKDEIRDDKFRGMYYLVKGYTHYSDKKINEAATVIERVINKYGLSLISGTYAAETSHINSLLRDLNDQQTAKQLNTLPGLTNLLEELKTAHSDFKNTYETYNEEKALDSSLKNASEIRNESLKAINSVLVPYLRVMEHLQDEKYTGFIRNIAEAIETNNENAKRRFTKNGEVVIEEI